MLLRCLMVADGLLHINPSVAVWLGVWHLHAHLFASEPLISSTCHSYLQFAPALCC